MLTRVRRRVKRWRARARRGSTAVLLALAGPVGHLVRALPGLIGLLALGYGAWLAYPPAGFITVGVLLLADKIATERRRDGKRGGGG